jgi:hypothetical protein
MDFGKIILRNLQSPMRTLYSIILCTLVLPFSLAAQQFKGRVSDVESGLPIPMALITNTRSGSMWLSDSSGMCAFSAEPGDMLRIEHTAYKDYKLQIRSYEDLISIRMERAPIELKGVTVESPYTRFSRDSAFFRDYYHKEIGYSGSQIGMGNGGIVAVDGMFSELALVVSGKKKRAKRFAEDLQMLEEWRYQGIRYTPQLVMSQTGLDDSTANAFIVKHPMPSDLVRTGSELMLKSWVRDEYRASEFYVKRDDNPMHLSGTMPKNQVDSVVEVK